MATRLDRLLLLLDTGSNATVRLTAARQLGQLAAARVQHASSGGPGTAAAATHEWRGVDGEWQEIVNLLDRIAPFLRSKSFDTRNAAAQAIEQVCKSVGVWDPSAVDGGSVKEEADADHSPHLINTLGLERLAGFDLSAVINSGPLLLASAGTEYVVHGGSSAEAQAAVRKAMGMGPIDVDVGVDVGRELAEGGGGTSVETPATPREDVKMEDMSQADSVAPSPNLVPETPCATDIPSPEDLSTLSARELNALKRKRKLAGKLGHPLPPPPAKKRAVESVDGKPVSPPPQPNESGAPNAVVVAHKAKATTSSGLSYVAGEWPYTSLVQLLMNELLDPGWPQRHGAALGLLSVLRSQLIGLRACGLLSECATAVCGVLARDRFGDYLGDQVVAPVRETASQVLGLLGKEMTQEELAAVVEALGQMVLQAGAHSESGADGAYKYAWQVRHAGLLGLKYVVAVQAAVVNALSTAKTNSDQGQGTLLRRIREAALVGLKDSDDDVRAAAAACLLPIAEALVEGLHQSEVGEVLEVLWDALAEGQSEGGRSLDDLNSSVGNLMDLIVKLITFPRVLDLMHTLSDGRTLPSLIPRLFPFFRHTITSVRLSVVRALGVFAKVEDLNVDSWLLDGRVVRLLMQNLIVETRSDVRDATVEVWRTVIQALGSDRLPPVVTDWIEPWLRTIETPRGQQLEITCFYNARQIIVNQTIAERRSHQPYNVDKPMLTQDMALITSDDVWKARLAASDALGFLIASLPVDHNLTTSCRQHMLLSPDQTGMSGTIRPFVVTTWATLQPIPVPWADEIASLYSSSVVGRSPEGYPELEVALAGIHRDAEGLVATFSSLGKVPPSQLPSWPAVGQGFSISMVKGFVEERYNVLMGLVPRGARKVANASLEDRKSKLAHAIFWYENEKTAIDVQTGSALAGALVAMQKLPSKISPVIKALTESLKFEENLELQRRSAESLTSLCDIATSPSSPLRIDPSPKIIGNLATFLCQDTSVTPTWASSKTNLHSILLTQDSRFTTGSATPTDPATAENEELRQARLLRRGSELALSALAGRFGDHLIDRIPKLWSCMCEPLVDLFHPDAVVASVDKQMTSDDRLGQALLDCLTVIPVAAERVPPMIQERFASLFTSLIRAIRSSFSIVRFAAARCFALLCTITPEMGLNQVVHDVIPIVADPTVVDHRRGAIELIARLVEILDIKILPYVIFLIVPVLGRMSDADDDVRYVATRTFAALIKLVPLEAGVPDPPGFSQDMLERRCSERDFLGQLLGTSQIEEYKLPVEIKADLRKYQREGISWLAFLAKYQLHGVLCDDMGLGKTLQSICILASKHHERAVRYEKMKSPDAVHLPSLVVCPPTLTGHWQHEIRTYAKQLKSLLYVGLPFERSGLFSKIRKHDVVIMSYDIVRNDIADLAKITWNYCILDEGHIIKNGKSKLARAVKQIQAQHRLILSGTPIQNNALELWSLFDFLMPGFLGSEKSFNERFGKPITASRDAKSSSKEQEAGALALEALHKQVLPFLLRRLKEDVLDDLPPKIIQDYYCELSPLQRSLYGEFAKSKVKAEVEVVVKTGGSGANGGGDSQHVFQALQYLKKLVNHPSLVVQADNPRHQQLIETHGGLKTLSDPNHAPKLLALRQILRDCGIGLSTAVNGADHGVDAAASQHRVLIFCQMKEMLNIIQRDLFAALMPTVTYMRLDGSTEASKRHSIVQQFNADPSIDCLLLTTHVGGLGLNLTGADTVIFVEHDWNPMKDLQAMDRAHRLGQKKVVNVYRLITRATLEEKIMGLQRFKLNIASSIVTQQNSNLGSLDTDQILDLFNISSVDDDKAAADDGTGSKKKKNSARSVSSKNVLEGLEALPPVEEYSSFDTQQFVASL